MDVGPAEGVDGLLRVADQDERRRLPAERPLHDLPLDGVGVLELVDEDDAMALAQAGARRGSGGGVAQRVPQPRQEVVVGQDLAPPLALVDLATDHGGQSPAHRPCRRPVGVRRLECGIRVEHGHASDAPGLGDVERRDAAQEPADVEVVDDLVDEVAGILEEGGVGVDVAGHTESAQDVLAEPVGGRDRRRVELGQGDGEAAATERHDVLGAGSEQAEHVVAGGRGDAGERPGEAVLGRHEPLPHAGPQLAGRHPAERHEEHVVERRAIGDVAGGERRDGERLAGAGAGLEHGHAGRQGPAHVERSGPGHGRFVRCSQPSRPLHRRWA